MQRNRFKFLVTVTAFLLLSTGAAHAQSAATGEGYIVTFRDRVSAANRASAVRAAGAKVKFNYSVIRAAAVTVPNENALRALQNNPDVVRIDRDRPVVAHKGKPSNKPGGGNNGGGDNSGGQVVPSSIKRVLESNPGPYNGSGVGILIGDSGVDLSHSDLNASDEYVDAFVGGTCQAVDGHGTHVAGLAAAVDNSIDIVGAAPGATVYCGKALDDTGSGTDSTIIVVLEWAATTGQTVDPPVQVVNLSLGRPKFPGDDNGPIANVIAKLYEAGIVVVTSAGNDPGVEVKDQMPAGLPTVIAVASTTAETGSNRCRRLSAPIAADTASFFTTDGEFVGGVGVTISAPGERSEDVNRGCFIKSNGILSLKVGGGTTDTLGGSAASGTSMAAPVVSGLVARYLQMYGGGSSGSQLVEQVRSDLMSDADQVTSAPLDSPTTTYSYDGVREGIAQAP